MAKENIERLNLVLRTIRNVNRIITKAKDRAGLLQDICDALMENRGYHNAWIVQLDESGNLVSTAHAGFGSKFQSIIKMFENRELPDCAKKALMQSAVVTIKDPHSTCPNCPLLSENVSRAAASVRLEHHGNIYGVLSVSIPQDYLLDHEEQVLLEEFAEDIAWGLHNIEFEENHKQTDKKLQESEKRFRTLIENSLSGFSIIQRGKVVYQNPEQERLLGPLPRSPKFMDSENIYPDDIEKVKNYYKEISLRSSPIQDLDFRFYPKNKKGNYQELIWVHCRSAPIEYQGEKSILTNLTDITPIKQIENLLRIQDKMESLGRIASGVAHEIRNPLSGVNVFLDGIRENFEDPENAADIKELIGQAKSASAKIESIVKRVLDFSRPSLPKFALKDINKPIKEAIHLSHVSLRKAGIGIELNLSDAIRQVHIDAQLIEQVLLNMITNAAEALKDIQGRKVIAITSRMEKDSVFIIIGDSGTGVESDIREKIFDPFYTTRTQGSGIGLSICQRIISDHGGLIEVSKSELGGAEFIIKIPQQSA